MPAILTIGRTDLKNGYFYILHNDRHIETADDWVVSPAPDGKRHGDCGVSACKRRMVERFKCSANPKHGEEEELYDYEIDLTNVRLPLTPFVSEHDHVIVNEWLADRLKTSGLKGFRLLPATVSSFPMLYKDEATTPVGKLFQLTFDGVHPGAIPHVEPASADKCPNCGAGPIVCPECGFCINPCVKCGEDWGVSERRYEGKNDRRIKIERLGASIDVIDPRSWDGTDFMGSSHGGKITRRALDWLLSIHAGPFVAQPIAVNVFGLSATELARLETVRKPLPNVTPPRLEAFSKKPHK